MFRISKEKCTGANSLPSPPPGKWARSESAAFHGLGSSPDCGRKHPHVLSQTRAPGCFARAGAREHGPWTRVVFISEHGSSRKEPGQRVLGPARLPVVPSSVTNFLLS